MQVPSGRRVTGETTAVDGGGGGGVAAGSGGGRSVTAGDEQATAASASICRTPSSVSVQRSRPAST